MFDILTAAHPATVDQSARTVTGVVAYYDQSANTSYGRVLFERGSIILPDDLSRVKLCLDHDHHTAVGYATSATDEGDRLVMSFHIPETGLGTEALASAQAGLRDGLSVGAYPTPDGAQYVNGEDTYHITAAHLREVSLCAIPAFDAARVTDVKAHHTAPEGMPMPPAETSQAPQPIVTASAPKLLTASDAARLVATMTTSGAPLAQIRAALNDITPDNDKGHGFVGRPAWLGEFWQARQTARPLIDSITHKDLPRATKVQGWRWKTRPTVAKYSGNKTEIPSNKPETEPVEADVTRVAGGWDTDRIYVDLGDASMIESLWEAGRESCAYNSEAEVVAALAAAATKLTGAPADLLPALVLLGSRAASIGATLSFITFSADVWTKFLELKKEEVPWWITKNDSISLSTTEGSVNGLRLFVSTSLEAGTILAGDSRAATHYEEKTPIRVNAVDLPRGGVDLGIFGYHATIVNDPRSLFKITAG